MSLVAPYYPDMPSIITRIRVSTVGTCDPIYAVFLEAQHFRVRLSPAFAELKEAEAAKASIVFLVRLLANGVDRATYPHAYEAQSALGSIGCIKCRRSEVELERTRTRIAELARISTEEARSIDWFTDEVAKKLREQEEAERKQKSEDRMAAVVQALEESGHELEFVSDHPIAKAALEEGKIASEEIEKLFKEKGGLRPKGG